MREKAPYGGQAVIEGVMMRGPRFFAVACRRENKEIVIEQESVESILKKFQWLSRPFLRGTLALIDSLALGMKALTFSANIAMEDAEKSDPKRASKTDIQKAVAASDTRVGAEQEVAGKQKRQPINDIAIGATMVLALGLAVLMFFVFPQFLVGLLKKWVERPVWLNIIVGGVKLAIFVGYIAAISMMKDIRRVFEYHGAEHKVINTFEAGMDLTPENISKFTTIHPRCGTSFILVVIFANILVSLFLGWTDALHIRVLQRLALLPVVAGLAYEIIRYAGRHKESKIMKTLLAPGLLMQRLTTREPSDDQVEVALRALQAVIEKEEEVVPAVV